MITAESLTHIPLFAFLPETERASLAARAADVRLQQGEWLIVEGQTAAFFALLDGKLTVVKSIAGHDHDLTTFVPGDYFGEVPLLLGTPAVASVRAVEPARVMRLDPADFHDLISHCRVLNGEIMKTMALRVGRIQQVVVENTGIAATVVGRRDDVTCFAVREFLSRNRVVFAWRDLDDPDTFDRLACDGIIESAADGASAFADARLPLVILADRSRLEAPTLPELAQAVGLQTIPRHDAYDVVIVGGGPAGLAAAVYGASEGLSTLLVERVACGGQAGTSSRIENYLGFPSGLSGDELSGKARQQALRFNAELLVARSVDAIEPGAPLSPDPAAHRVVLDDGTRLTTKAVIMANGVQWRRLETPGIDHLTGRGVYYGASATEALGVRGRTIHLVGGGNSAGQAAVFLSQHAAKVNVLVRGPSLAATMSRYLIDRIEASDNIELHPHTELVALHGEPGSGLNGATWRDRRSGLQEDCPARNIFLFIGAVPETDWLEGCGVALDKHGFVLTGQVARGGFPAKTAAALESSVPGVFAVGDVRSGSVKRVGGAIGEGAAVVALIHQHLAAAAATAA